MLVLFETPAGYALFKLTDEGKLDNADDMWKDFESAESARKLIKLKAFEKFDNTTEALAAATALVEGKLSKGLKKFLQKAKIQEELAVSDSKLGGVVKEKLGIACVFNPATQELIRGIRSQLSELITGLSDHDMKAMVLGLSHSLCRYKLKFSPDKIDTMIVQAIGLLDELDKELNTYSMRVREWYGWHFPELTKIVADNTVYAKVVKKMGVRTNASKTDLSDILPEELESELKEAAEISMGTEVTEGDIENIQFLCDQVISMGEYRAQLYDYLKNRMQAIAPNLTILLGELVGARLIAHAGSLLNLAKHPASTVQILGAEKALFRALKTKHDTPKYGLIFHASLVGQAAPKLKGKISRVLAAKAALSIRVDALGDKDAPTIAFEQRAKLEARMRQLDGKAMTAISGTGKSAAKYTPGPAATRETKMYNAEADVALDGKGKKKEKRKAEVVEVKEEAQDEEAAAPAEDGGKKKKKKKAVAEEEPTPAPAPAAAEPKKKKVKKLVEEEPAPEEPEVQQPEKKKKKKKAADE